MAYASPIATVVALICLFLFAITKFSHQIERNAGNRFKAFIHRVTSTPVYGALAGFATAAIFQSSSATMVIAVSLVHAGIMPFTSSLGVLIGANVGTTLTTQLVAFKITAIAPYFLIAGLLLHYFGRGYKRFEFTVISDAVNLASRLEGLTKIYGAPILISDAVFERLNNQNDYQYRMLGRVQVKGKTDSIGILEIIHDPSPEIAEFKSNSKPMFERGIAFYLQKQHPDTVGKRQ
jgi:hypothetical protein